GEELAVAVLVLEALAEQGRAPGRRPEQEAPRARIRGRPEQVADPLEAEHRVEGEERDHRDAPVGVAGAGRDEAGRRARLGDALSEVTALPDIGVLDQARR